MEFTLEELEMIEMAVWRKAAWSLTAEESKKWLEIKHKLIKMKDKFFEEEEENENNSSK